MTTGPLLSKLAHESVPAATTGGVKGYDDYTTFTHEKSGMTFFLNFSNDNARNFYLPEPKEGLFYNVYFANLDLANPRVDYAPINIIMVESERNESLSKIQGYYIARNNIGDLPGDETVILNSNYSRVSVSYKLAKTMASVSNFYFPNLFYNSNMMLQIKCLKLNETMNPSWVIMNSLKDSLFRIDAVPKNFDLFNFTNYLNYNQAFKEIIKNNIKINFEYLHP